MGRPFLTPLAHGNLSSEAQLLCQACNIALCYANLDVIRTDYQCHSGQALFVS